VRREEREDVLYAIRNGGFSGAVMSSNNEVGRDAEALVVEARRSAKRSGVVESFLQQFSLNTKEGLVLMGLAEAVLRTPDEDTKDALIAEKISSADWASHVGKSDSVFVNASAWGLMLTGKIVEPDEHARRDLGGFIKGLANRMGEPVIRAAQPPRPAVGGRSSGGTVRSEVSVPPGRLPSPIAWPTATPNPKARPSRASTTRNARARPPPPRRRRATGGPERIVMAGSR